MGIAILPRGSIYSFLQGVKSMSVVVRKWWIACVCGLALGVLPFYDGQAQSIPSTVDPGQVEKRFDLKDLPKVRTKIVIPQVMDDAPIEGAESITFDLTAIEIEGATALSDEGVRWFYRSLIGETVSLDEVYEATRQLTEYYRQGGFVLSRAVIPAQRVQDGVVKIKVIEGYVSRVTFEGDIQGSKSLLEGYASHITEARPLNAGTLEHYLLLMDDLPGVEVKTLLRPSDAEVGAAELLVTMSHKEYNASVAVDNRGTKYMGPVQLTGRVSFNSGLGLYERFSYRGIVSSQTDELQFVDATVTQPVGSYGTLLKGRVARSLSEAGASLGSLDVEGDSTTIELGVVQPLIRSRRHNLIGMLEGRYHNSTTDVLQSSLNEDKVRSVSLGFTYDRLDAAGGISFLQGEVTQGIDLFDDIKDKTLRSRTNGDATFTKFALDASYARPLVDKLSVFVGASGQYALDSLLASEEYALGGSAYGRAYDAAEITGDHGAAGSIEIIYQCLTGVSYFSRFDCYAFYDGGAVWNKTAVTGELSRETLVSTGVGNRFALGNGVSGSVEVAVPLTRKVASEVDDDVRGFFSLKYAF